MKITKLGYVASIAMMAGLSSQADETQLKLHEKTVLVCPIMLQEAGKHSSDDDAWQYADEMAEGLGIMLEREGMLPSISPHYPESIRVEENLACSYGGSDPASASTDIATANSTHAPEAYTTSTECLAKYSQWEIASHNPLIHKIFQPAGSGWHTLCV